MRPPFSSIFCWGTCVFRGRVSRTAELVWRRGGGVELFGRRGGGVELFGRRGGGVAAMLASRRRRGEGF